MKSGHRSFGLLTVVAIALAMAVPSTPAEAGLKEKFKSAWNKLRRSPSPKPAGNQALKTSASAAKLPASISPSARGIRPQRAGSEGTIRPTAPTGRPTGVVNGSAGPAPAAPTQWERPMPLPTLRRTASIGGGTVDLPTVNLSASTQEIKAIIGGGVAGRRASVGGNGEYMIIGNLRPPSEGSIAPGNIYDRPGSVLHAGGGTYGRVSESILLPVTYGKAPPSASPYGIAPPSVSPYGKGPPTETYVRVAPPVGDGNSSAGTVYGQLKTDRIYDKVPPLTGRGTIYGRLTPDDALAKSAGTAGAGNATGNANRRLTVYGKLTPDNEVRPKLTRSTAVRSLNQASSSSASSSGATGAPKSP
ncbi:hypothetical protein [Humisphaera borealis]|uniref:Plug domain-containing protein n=1 Tax=Humisphaera borealis TaxID=2807512 RepID=A0A7M2WXW9_9BACT|nr:hypothetical protein [Humisphaera borealis]QOV90253.1 hypothetical protein IPV69_02440 [Humisphaera borealis]